MKASRCEKLETNIVTQVSLSFLHKPVQLPFALLPIQLPANEPRKADYGSNIWVPAAYTGDHVSVPGVLLWFGPAQTFMIIGTMSQLMKDFLFLSLSPYLSHFAFTNMCV